MLGIAFTVLWEVARKQQWQFGPFLLHYYQIGECGDDANLSNRFRQ